MTLENLWVWIRLSETSEQRIRAIQEALEPSIPSAFEIETDLHVSVLPGVTIPTEDAHEFRAAVNNIHITNKDLSVTGIKYHPSDCPYVITLDVDINIKDARTYLLDLVNELGGTIKYDPVDPHITLFKSGDSVQSKQITDSEELDSIKQRIKMIELDDSLLTEWVDCDFQIKVNNF